MTKDINDLEIINCHKEDTKVLLYNGKLEMVQNIKINDYIMSGDCKALKIKNIINGIDKMYKVTDNLTKESFIVNQDYVLTLKYTNNKKLKCSNDTYYVYWFDNINMKERMEMFKYNEENKLYVQIFAQAFYNSIKEIKEINISIEDYLIMPHGIKRNLKIIRYVAYFTEKPTVMDPYIYGSIDGNNVYNMVSNVNIKDIYMHNSLKVRLSYIAGVIDHYGYVDYDKYKIDIYNDSQYSKDLIFIINSAGINTTLKENYKKDNFDEYKIYTITIYGNYINTIPTKINKLQTKKIKKPKKYKTNISIEEYGDNKICYGFVFEKKEQYFLSNFIISNSCH